MIAITLHKPYRYTLVKNIKQVIYYVYIPKKLPVNKQLSLFIFNLFTLLKPDNVSLGKSIMLYGIRRRRSSSSDVMWGITK